MNPQATEWANLTAFKQQIIIAALRKGGDPDAEGADRPSGLGIMGELEVAKSKGLNHGRMYPNLDDLVRNDFLDKGSIDGRTNGYTVTEEAVEAYAAYLSDFVGIDVDAEDVVEAPAKVHDKQTERVDQ